MITGILMFFKNIFSIFFGMVTQPFKLLHDLILMSKIKGNNHAFCMIHFSKTSYCKEKLAITLQGTTTEFHNTPVP